MSHKDQMIKKLVFQNLRQNVEMRTKKREWAF